METLVREAFVDLTGDPPAFAASVDDILPAGQRARRRRRRRMMAVTVPAVVGLSAAGVLGAASLIGGHPAEGHRVTVRFASGGSSPQATAAGSAADQAVLNAVETASPAGFRFAVHPLTRPVEDEFGIDGSANDGHGAGRLYVVVDPLVGMLEATPCSDPEFVAGGTCTSTTLPDGNQLVLRGENGSTYTQVLAVVIHPDGTGVTAESDNGTFADLFGRLTTRELARDKRNGQAMEKVTRADPTYTVTELGQVAVAADRAATQCIEGGCPAS